jgi:heavy metal translocating P-type ATPase
MRRFAPILLLAVPALALAAGLAMLAAGMPAEAAWVFQGGTAVVLAALLVVIARSLASGAFGLDAIAAFSMAGALFVGENLAGNVIALMFAGGQVLESVAQGRAEREMTALLARQPRSARRLEGDTIAEVPLEAVRPGDILLVRGGDVVAVDGAVVSAVAILDEAALTGESVPMRRAAGQPVMSGSTNVGPAFDMMASRTVSQSTYAGIVRLVETAQRERAPMARLADRWGIAFLGLTAMVAGGTWFATQDAVRTLAVLVVATPCPLILAVPVAIVAGLSRCAGHGVLVKTGAALEAMARARVVLIDKTGTLTSGQPRIGEITCAPGMVEQDLLFLAASLAQASPHVMSAALVREARERGLGLGRAVSVREEHGAGLAGAVQGRSVALGGLDFLSGHLGADGNAGDDGLEDSGAALIHVAIDGTYAGCIAMVDEPRPEARDVLEGLRSAGIKRIVLVTGDREAVARTVAADLPIDRIVAGALPAEKVAIVRQESQFGATLMVGDGVNDAPALAAAGVGVAMGVRGAAASAEAADVVILQDSLDRLPLGLQVARRARRIALQSVAAGMGLSLLAMAAAALGALSPLQGALLQEVIDVAVIMNALRVLSDPR